MTMPYINGPSLRQHLICKMA